MPGPNKQWAESSWPPQRMAAWYAASRASALRHWERRGVAQRSGQLMSCGCKRCGKKPVTRQTVNCACDIRSSAVPISPSPGPWLRPAAAWPRPLMLRRPLRKVLEISSRSKLWWAGHYDLTLRESESDEKCRPGQGRRRGQSPERAWPRPRWVWAWSKPKKAWALPRPQLFTTGPKAQFGTGQKWPLPNMVLGQLPVGSGDVCTR